MTGHPSEPSGSKPPARLPARLGVAVVAALLSITAAIAPAAAAGAHREIAPHQAFQAAVNGLSGAGGPVTIAMACSGPIQPGQTGHPLPGQTVAVTFVPVPQRSTVSLGYTGDRGTSIGAFFGAPPPAAPMGAMPSYIPFDRYGTRAIPTSMVLPCHGTEQVTFVPLPLDPSERSTAVPVQFAGQP